MLNFKKITAVTFMSLLVISNSYSAIIGIETVSTAEAIFDRTDSEGNPIELNFEGEQISEEFGNSSFGSAIVFDASSGFNDDGDYEWQNGNASYGDGVTSTSRTVVDISFQNNTDDVILPSLNSEILSAGLGMYSTGCDASNLRLCETGESFFMTLINGGDGSFLFGETIASSSFNFMIMSGDIVLFELSGGMSLLYGGEGGNFLATDFSNAADFLNDFSQTSSEDDPREMTFDWKATDINITLPQVLALNPGDIGSITYITEVTTFSDSFCLLEEADESSLDCIMAYGAFGDPVGRGGGARPRITGLDLDIPLIFDKPTFENGVITLRQNDDSSTVDVSSPATAALAFISFGVLSLRIKRK